MANYRRMMEKWKDWRLDEEIENETSVPFEVIGKNSIIGAHSLVNKDIPDNVVAFGVPAKVVRSLNNE